MPLILAIEADKRQATLLASVGRLVEAELIIAPTAERGLEAIAGRVPDLILTSALLSPRDDATIAARLRDLDAAAAHVQMLTIPVLAKASRRQSQSGSGLLGKLRGSSDAAVPTGCDPALFAEQVVEYLQRAAAERAAREEAARHSPAPSRTVSDAIGDAVSGATGSDATGSSLAPIPVQEWVTDGPEAAVRAHDDEPLALPSHAAPEMWVDSAPESSAAPTEPPQPDVVLPATREEPGFDVTAAAATLLADVGVEGAPGSYAARDEAGFDLTAAAAALVEYGRSGDTPTTATASDNPVLSAPPPPAQTQPESRIGFGPSIDVSDDVTTEAPAVASAESTIEGVLAIASPVEEERPGEATLGYSPLLGDARVIHAAVDAASTETDPAAMLETFSAGVQPSDGGQPPTVSADSDELLTRAKEPAPLEVVLAPGTGPAAGAASGDPEIELAGEPADAEIVELNAATLGTDVDALLREFEAAIAAIAAADAAASAAAARPISPGADGANAGNVSTADVFELDPLEMTANGGQRVEKPGDEMWAELAKTTWPALENFTAPAAGASSGHSVETLPPTDVMAAGSVVEVRTPPEAPSTTGSGAASAAPETADAPGDPRPSKKAQDKKRRKARPQQDEWGLFDPEQCGFAALLEKLDEIASDDAA